MLQSLTLITESPPPWRLLWLQPRESLMAVITWKSATSNVDCLGTKSDTISLHDCQVHISSCLLDLFQHMLSTIPIQSWIKFYWLHPKSLQHPPRHRLQPGRQPQQLPAGSCKAPTTLESVWCHMWMCLKDSESRVIQWFIIMFYHVHSFSPLKYVKLVIWCFLGV